MRDQEQKLRRTGVVAARLDSTLTTKETERTLDDIEEGKRKIIYVTPSARRLWPLGRRARRSEGQPVCRR